LLQMLRQELERSQALASNTSVTPFQRLTEPE
jgi:hypothetical protein